MLSRADILEWLNYDPATGVFTWKKRKGRAAAGAVAGRVNLGYVVLKFAQQEFAAHRVAWLLMTGEWPVDQIDHIERCRSNNRWSNLRAATNKQNHENLPVLKTNTSGRSGVRWDSDRGKWFAYITHHGRMKNLGRYRSFEEAVAARASAEQQCFTHHPAAAEQ